MNYKKQIGIWLGLLFLVLVSDYFWMYSVKNGVSCNTFLDCKRILVFGAPYQYYALPSIAILFSLSPLFFLKEGVYKAWRKFALVAVPVVAVLIIISPSSTGGGFGPDMGLDRESAAMFFSFLFVLVSFILIIYKSFKLRSKK